nr:MCE family protein [Deltaproteobacteria bacterium]
MATTELKVGIFTAAALGIIVFGYFWSVDGMLAPGETAYELNLTVPSADGVYEGTQVRIAGVEIGSIDRIELDGNQARLVLGIESSAEIPTDSFGELGSSGLLGDRYVRITPGVELSTLPDGGTLPYGTPPGDFDNITRQVEALSEDVAAITKVLREEVENDDNRDHVRATLANVDALSAALRLMAEQNREDVNAIVDSVRRLSESLEGVTTETGADLDEEMEKLKAATDTLQRTLDDVESITGKVDDGQGTIGALVNDRATVDALNETIENANAVIESFSGLHAEVYYTGRYYVGTQPDDPAFFYGNPLAGSAANTLGMELHPQEDFWWVFEVNDYPQGYISATERFYPETGFHYTEWTRELDYRFTFQMAKRWFDFGFRLGIKEG